MNNTDLFVSARVPKGFRDIFSNEWRARQFMIKTITHIYDLHGFDPLETPALEYVDVLGKYLPDNTPSAGIFSLKDDEDNLLALRYDLTAPLSRVVVQYQDRLPIPFKRYQVGPVWRVEKPGLGRFREFYQCDFDIVGSASMIADTEVLLILCEALESLGIKRGCYKIHVNHRGILDGILEKIGVHGDEEKTLKVLRAIDKLDRVGFDGVGALLSEGRMDPSGDFTPGANLSNEQIEAVFSFLRSGCEDRGEVSKSFWRLVSGTCGEKAVFELEEIDRLLSDMGIDSDRVVFNPCIVRGLGYYTGPVFEAILDERDQVDGDGFGHFGSVAGGGRYDNLVQRFTGRPMPATGACIGVDRLLQALIAMGKIANQERNGVVVTVMDRSKIVEYMKIAKEIRDAQIPVDVYLGGQGFRKQMKYADMRNARVVVIVGEDEFSKNQVTLKDMMLGETLSSQITDRDEWRKGQPAQITVPRDQMVEKIKEILAKSYQ